MTSPNQQLNSDELAAQYGYAEAFFNIDPELKSLLDQAVKGQWTADKFKAKFMASNWYRNHSAAARSWSELNARSPAEAQDQINKKTLVISQMAKQLGVQIDDKRIRDLATWSLQFGWDDTQLRASVGSEWKYTQNPAGQAATTEDQIRQIAGDYGVTVSDGDMAKYTMGILRGDYTQDNYTDFVRDLARSKYPGMRSYIDQGFSVRQVASPYTQSYAQILEVDPSSVNLQDPHIQRALQGTPDPKTGQATMQSVYDFERTLRQDPRWQYTKNAHDSLTSVADGVLRDFGLYS